MTKSQLKLISLSSLGGLLEFYDFVIYALFAPYLGQAFFPSSDPIVILINTYAVFAVGYLGRTLGSVIFGHIGDRYGRKQAFTIASFMMASATFLMGCLPTYYQIGITASILLIFFRILQGISIGGEVGGATVFIFEHVPYKKRGLAIGVIFMALTLGNVLGSLIGYILTHVYAEKTLFEWAWRIPFWLGFVLSMVAYIIRRKTIETPEFTALEPNQKVRIPIMTLLKFHLPQVFKSIGLTAIPGTTFALLMYLPNYLSLVSQLSLNNIFFNNLITFLMMSFFTLVFGFVSDYIEKKKIIMISSFLIMFSSYYLFQSIFYLHSLLLFDCCLAVFSAMLNGCYTCAIAEQFETPIRYTGMAFSYGIGVTLFAGMTPLVSILLFNVTHQVFAPIFFLIFCAGINLLVGIFLNEPLKKNENFILAAD